MAGLEIPEDLDLTNLDEKRKLKAFPFVNSHF
jgi:hypothetical protein